MSDAVTTSGPREVEAASEDADIVMFVRRAYINRLQWGVEEARKARRDLVQEPDGARVGAYINVVCHQNLQAAREFAVFLSGFMRFSAGQGKISGPMSEGDGEELSEIRISFNVNEHAMMGLFRSSV